MSNEYAKNVLPLKINSNEYEWNRQYISGAEIRALGSIPDGHEIFLKISSPWEDELVSDNSQIDLARPGIEHFYSKEVPKEFDLYINGRLKKWEKKEISFKEVIMLAFGKYDDRPTMIYTVAYEDGPKQNPEGSMVRGAVVFVKNKMIFHVTETDKS